MSTSSAYERQVLGALLLDPVSVLPQIAGIMSGADFDDKRLGKTFDLALSIAQSGPLDTIILDAALKGHQWRPSAYDLTKMIGETLTVSNSSYYARLVADQAQRRRLATAGARIKQLADADIALDEALSLARAEWDAAQTGNAGRTLDARLLADLLAKGNSEENDGNDPDNRDDYEWIIPNLLERKDRLVLVGTEGSGKTHLLRQIGLCAAAGVHPFTQTLIPDVAKVLVIDAENTWAQWRRESWRMRKQIITLTDQLGAWCDPAENCHVACVPRQNLLNPKDLGAAHQLVDRHKPDILIIGPLYRLIPKAINTDDEAAPLLAALDGFRDKGCALLIEAHAGHGKGEGNQRELRPRGSSALLGWPEFGYGLRAIKQAPGDDYPLDAELQAWRGDRDASRQWPKELTRTGALPWNPL